MLSRTQSARRTLGTGFALHLAVSILAFGEDLPEPVVNVTLETAPGFPTGPPGPPPPMRGTVPRCFTPDGAPTPVRPFFGQATLPFAPSLDPGSVTDSRREGFTARLMTRMSREARRFERERVSEARGALPIGLSDDLDSSAAARRRTEAARVVTRSVHRALDEELDRMARSSLGLGPTLDFLQNLSLRRLPAGGSGQAGKPDGLRSSPASALRPDGLRGDIGLRLDAHPALFLRARFRGLRGRIELPVRDDPARLSLESPIGVRGRALLSAGLPRDGQTWATLIFNFSF